MAKSVAKFMSGAAAAFFLVVVAVLLWLKADSNRAPLSPLMLECEVTSMTASPGRLIVDGQRASDFQLPAESSFTPLSIRIPEGPEPITSIRIDPLQQKGDVQFRNVRITRGGQILATISFENLISLNPQAQVSSANGAIRVRHTSDADYPALLISRIYPLKTAVYNSAVFGRGSLVLCVASGCAFLILLISGMTRSALRTGWKSGLLFAGFFLVVYGARLVTLQHLGDRVPNWDYWQMPWTVYLPYMDGTLTWQGMIAPVNEHRVFFARLFSLALFLLNGQWENLYEAAAMSLMHALTATGLALVLWNAGGRKQTLPILLLVFGATALPFSWENTIWANQSQFYFFVGFSVLTIWLLGMHKPLSARWWLGCSTAMAAQFTVGSGILAPVIVTALSAYRLLRDAEGRRDASITFGAGLALTAFASVFRVKSQSAGMMTKGFDQFIQTFGKTMSWPFTESIWLWVFLWMPVVVFIILSIIKRKPWSKAEAWTVALGGWVLLNALGVGIFRGGFSGGPISRYMDLTALGMVANGLALFLLPGMISQDGRTSTWFKMGRSAWLVVMLAGVLMVTDYEVGVMARSRVEHQQRAIMNTRRYMQTGDLGFLMSKRHYEIPHPDPMSLACWLNCDALRAILPVSIREPLNLQQDSAIGFSEPGLYPAYNFDIAEPTWGSYGREGDRTVGTFLSKPLPAPRYSYLEIAAINRLSCRQNTVTMRLIDQLTGKSYRPCSLRDAIGDWRKVYVKVPKKPLLFEASDNDPIFWVAFQSPREISTLSYWSFRLLAAGPLVLAAGLIGLFVSARRGE